MGAGRGECGVSFGDSSGRGCQLQEPYQASLGHTFVCRDVEEDRCRLQDPEDAGDAVAVSDLEKVRRLLYRFL